jgi:hypothetical protein
MDVGRDVGKINKKKCHPRHGYAGLHVTVPRGDRPVRHSERNARGGIVHCLCRILAVSQLPPSRVLVILFAWAHDSADWKCILEHFNRLLPMSGNASLPNSVNL